MSPVESAVYVSLIVYVREQLEGRTPTAAYGVGVTVEKLSEKLDRSPSSVRSALNEVGRTGLVVAEGPGKAVLLAPGSSAKEKIWRPTHRLDEEEIKNVLKEHPEIVKHLGKDTLEQVLKIKLD